MRVYTRREFSKLTLTAAVPLAVPVVDFAAPKFSFKFNGVHIGVQTYSYRSLRDISAPWSPSGVDSLMDRVASAIAEDGIDLCEFWVALVEPPGGLGRPPWDSTALQGRENLRKWRMSRPLDIFERARKRFNDAGIEIYASMSNFDDKCDDDEIEWAFDVAKTLGTGIITANCTVASIKRVAPFADKHETIVSAHSEDPPFDPNIDGMVFADNLLDTAKLSPYLRITLDIGHFTAYGGDAVRFVRENHGKITNLHLKDRLKNHPEPHTDENTPEWGKGNAPIKQVLQLMKAEKYPFPACIEYEYKSDKPAVIEVRRCLDSSRSRLKGFDNPGFSRAGNLLFTGDASGNFVAFAPENGNVLWHANVGAPVSNDPMTYELDGRQDVAGSARYAFSLHPESVRGGA